MLGDGLPSPKNADDVNYDAALWSTSNGNSLYASNRGEGSIVCLEVFPLRKAQTFFLPGKLPRDFCLLGDEMLIAACQDQGLYLLREGKVLDFLPCPGAVRVMELPQCSP